MVGILQCIGPFPQAIEVPARWLWAGGGSGISEGVQGSSEPIERSWKAKRVHLLRGFANSRHGAPTPSGALYVKKELFTTNPLLGMSEDVGTTQ